MSASSPGGSLEPAFQFSAVTPSNTALLTYTTSSGEVVKRKCKALYIGGAGNIAIKDDAGTAVTFVGVTAGSIYPISTDTVMLTNTTATSIIALY